MSTTQTATNSNQSSRQIHEDIRETRHDMDETLDELGDRLHPRHLLDDLIDLFRSSDSGPQGRQVADMCRSAGKSTARAVQEHPVPALLMGAGVAWWLFDQYTEDDEADWDALGDYDSRRHLTGGEVPYDYETSYAQQWRQESMPWHDTYEWHDESEESWSDRAQRTLGEVKENLRDTTLSAQEKLKHAAGKMMSLSGHKQREIHSRWASLREHSGSFVDARTGEPYDSNYGQEWGNLAAVNAIASSESATEDETVAEKAKASLEQLQARLSDAGGSVKDATRSGIAVLGDYGRGTGQTLKSFGATVAETTGHWKDAAGEQLTAAGRVTGRAARSVGRSTRRGAAKAQEQFSRGYETVRDSTAEAVDEYPLAVGAACFGLGLLGGLLLPRTRYEDELMGAAADEVRETAREAGAEAYQAGKEVAAATATAAMDEAKRQGLAPEQLAEQASEKASEMRDAVREATDDSDSAVGDVAERARSVAKEAAETARQQTKKKSEQVTS